MKMSLGFKVTAIIACVVTLFFFFFFATSQYRASREGWQTESIQEMETGA